MICMFSLRAKKKMDGAGTYIHTVALLLIYTLLVLNVGYLVHVHACPGTHCVYYCIRGLVTNTCISHRREIDSEEGTVRVPPSRVLPVTYFLFREGFTRCRYSVPTFRKGKKKDMYVCIEETAVSA